MLCKKLERLLVDKLWKLKNVTTPNRSSHKGELVCVPGFKNIPEHGYVERQDL